MEERNCHDSRRHSEVTILFVLFVCFFLLAVLSRRWCSLDSPCPSDIVSNSRVSGSVQSDGSSAVSAAASGTSITSLGADRGASTGGASAPWDSDIEADPDPPDWTRNLDPDVVDKMTPKEKQRQEVINGIRSSQTT